jgi:hypothetical protein
MAQLPLLILRTVLCNKAMDRRLHDAISDDGQGIRDHILHYIRVCDSFA